MFDSFFAFLKRVMDGAGILALAAVFLLFMTGSLLLIPYAIFVIISFIFVRPSLKNNLGLWSSFISLSKFYVSMCLKITFVLIQAFLIFIISKFGWLMIISGLGYESGCQTDLECEPRLHAPDWDGDSDIFMLGIGLLILAGMAYTIYNLFSVNARMFSGTKQKYLFSLGGHF